MARFPGDVDEELDMGELEQVDVSIVSSAKDRDYRSFIRHVDGTGRLEAVYDEEATVLVCTVDQGSSQWLALNWLAEVKKCRIVVFNDVCHRRDNNARLATRRAGLNPLKVAANITMNVLMGPWEEAQHFGKVSQVLNSFLRTHTWRSAIFQELYVELTLSREKGKLPAAFGSEAHQAAVWDWLSASDVLVKKGDATKPGRWFNYSARICRIENGSVLLLAGVLLGMAEGVYNSWAETPLGRHAMQRVPGEEEHVDGDALQQCVSGETFGTVVSDACAVHSCTHHGSKGACENNGHPHLTYHNAQMGARQFRDSPPRQWT
eukprot:1388326-Amphidinium_carterae.1